MAESRFLKFTQFLPTALEPRYASIRSDTITNYYVKRSGDLFCMCVSSGGDTFEVAETWEQVEKMVLEAEAKDRMGT